jgi:hypothetical protein
VALLTTPDDKPLMVSEATIITSGLDASTPVAPLPFAPAVRVSVRTGSNVQFHHHYALERWLTRIWIDGYLKLAGKLCADGLKLHGEFHSRRGELVFPNAALTLHRGQATIERIPGERPLTVRVDAEAGGRVGDYRVSLKPNGQIYPSMGPEFELNADVIPFLADEYVLALLGGPVVTPSAAGRSEFADLLAIPGRGQNGGAELTRVTLRPSDSGLGMKELALDAGFSGPVRLRLGEQLFHPRLFVTYVSALSGPAQSSTFRVTYELTPLYRTDLMLRAGWSVDELERSQWELQAFTRF